MAPSKGGGGMRHDGFGEKTGKEVKIKGDSRGRGGTSNPVISCLLNAVFVTLIR